MTQDASGPDRTGQTAVIFASQRRMADGEPADEAGYLIAAERMATLAAAQPGYRGLEAARGADGYGVTVSYWADDAAARAWRDQAEHAATRDAGRAHWYDAYTLTVATVGRFYRWDRG